MSLNKLKEQIKKGSFSNFYLLHGEETFLIRYYKHELIKAILGEEKGMNFSLFEGKQIDIHEVIGLATTLPFFSSHRVILIENSDFFSKQSELADKLSSIPSSTILIFSEETVDKRIRLYKTLAEKGFVIEFPIEEPNRLIQWIMAFCHKNEVDISKEAASYLLFRTGNSMDMLYKEMEKLISYAYEEKIITTETIETVCHENLQNKIYELMDFVGKKDRAKALSLYFDLVDLRESMRYILALILRHFRLTHSAKKLHSEGRSNYEIASILKLPPFVVKKHLSMASLYSYHSLKEAIDTCLSLDNELKTGGMEEQLAVETILLTLTK